MYYILNVTENLVQVSALLREKAELPCNLEPTEEQKGQKQSYDDSASEENSPLLVLWYKGNPFVPTTPIYR